jgi:ATP-binding cassette subfamily B protein
MKYQCQIDETDCGPACIVMVASHYHLYITIGKVRELSKTDYIGTNLMGMVYAAEKLGFTATPMNGPTQNNTLDENFIFPFIAHVRIKYEKNKILDHYVVVSGTTKNKVMIWDPDSSRGKHTMSRSDFLKIWTGYVLFLSPGTHFVPIKEKKSPLLKFLPLILPHKKNLIIVSLSSALLLVLGIVISYYFKYIIDEVVISKASFTLTAFSIGMILIIAVQSITEGLRGVLINYFAFKIN